MLRRTRFLSTVDRAKHAGKTRRCSKIRSIRKTATCLADRPDLLTHVVRGHVLHARPNLTENLRKAGQIHASFIDNKKLRQTKLRSALHTKMAHDAALVDASFQLSSSFVGVRQPALRRPGPNSTFVGALIGSHTGCNQGSNYGSPNSNHLKTEALRCWVCSRLLAPCAK